MNALLPELIQPNGRMRLKATVALLLFIFILSSCSADLLGGEGRGDWTLDLHGGYGISRINSRQKLFIHKENPDNSGGAIVLPSYFVTAYQVREPYICLEGIATQERSASEEELNDMVLSYYIVDAGSGEVTGPFESYDDFEEHCSSLALKIKDEWIKTDN